MRALVIAPQSFFSPRGTLFSVPYRTLAYSRRAYEPRVRHLLELVP
jgi:hypothetical protein